VSCEVTLEENEIVDLIIAVVNTTGQGVSSKPTNQKGAFCKIISCRKHLTTNTAQIQTNNLDF